MQSGGSFGFSDTIEEYEYPRHACAFCEHISKGRCHFHWGGLRAMFNGGGVFDGLDSHSTTASPNFNAGKPTVNGLWIGLVT
jgi:hypothetical protein